jgi:putative glycosyltransferase
MKLSIVATLYKSSAVVDEFVDRALAAAEPLFNEVEIVLVNDGSPDDSLAKALARHDGDSRIVVIDLARNFGHHKAIMTGLAHAQGDFVFLIDSDLEERPEYLAQFYETLSATNSDVAYGVQVSRKGGVFERLSGRLFFWAANGIGNEKLPANTVTSRLMTRDYVRALVQHQDREFVLGHLFMMAGYKQVPMPVTKLSISRTTYSPARRFDMAIRYLTTNSTRLLYAILCAGLTISSVAALAIVYLIVRYLQIRTNPDGWTSVIISVWFFGGLITLILGILGMYIANILSETKRGPYTIVRGIHRKPLPEKPETPRELVGLRPDSER